MAFFIQLSLYIYFILFLSVINFVIKLIKIFINIKYLFKRKYLISELKKRVCIYSIDGKITSYINDMLDPILYFSGYFFIKIRSKNPYICFLKL